MSGQLTALELARQIDAPVDRVDEWRSLGLIGRGGVQTFGPADLQRARLVQLLLRRGIPLDAVVQADKEEDFLSRYVSFMFPGGFVRTYTLSEAVQRVGLPMEAVRRFWESAGLADQGEALHEEDVRALEGIKVALDAGLPEEAMLQLARVYADALGRVAEAESRLFHFYVHERLKAEGLSGPALVEIVQASSDQVTPLVEPTILYFHRKGWQKAVGEDAVLHVREHAGLSEKGDVPGQMRAAIVFIDLSGFTSLAEAMGDETAARVLERFSQLVRDAVRRWDGRVVKQIGDAFMLVFLDPRSAVVCAVDIDRLTSREPQFPAVRTGIHCGQILYREGDYLGTNVNIAARLAAEAERHQILVTGSLRKEVAIIPDLEFVPFGKRRLRGLADELELFAVVPRRDAAAVVRHVDPVCGMELALSEAAATLSLEGETRVFCSQQCLQRFVAAPERYGATPSRS